MTKEQFKPLIEKAINTLKACKRLPIELDEITEKSNGIFILWFTDTKLLQKADGVTGQFYHAVFVPTYTDMNTNETDIIAKIPPNANDEARAMLRLAFLTYIAYMNNIRETYKKFAKPSTIINQANAMEWYNKL